MSLSLSLSLSLCFEIIKSILILVGFYPVGYFNSD
jgi:hypothetical protein